MRGTKSRSTVVARRRVERALEVMRSLALGAALLVAAPVSHGSRVKSWAVEVSAAGDAVRARVTICAPLTMSACVTVSLALEPPRARGFSW
jgi:hypothetical protein